MRENLDEKQETVGNDQECVQRYLSGDESGFRDLFEKYRKRLYHFILKQVLFDRETATDLLQDTFYKICARLHTYRPEREFSTWAFQIALNTVRDHQRKRSRQKTEAYENAMLDILMTGQDFFSGSPEKELLEKELRETVRRALQKLPEKQRTVFVLQKINGLSINEIGQMTGMKERQVKYVLAKGTAFLYRELLPYIRD